MGRVRRLHPLALELVLELVLELELELGGAEQQQHLSHHRAAAALW